MSLNSDTNSEARTQSPERKKNDLPDFLKQIRLDSVTPEVSTSDEYTDSDNGDFMLYGSPDMIDSSHVDELFRDLRAKQRPKGGVREMFQTLDSEKLSKPLKPNLKKTLSNQMRLNRKNLFQSKEDLLLMGHIKSSKEFRKMSISDDSGHIEGSCHSTERNSHLIRSNSISVDEMMETINRITNAYLRLKSQNLQLVNLIESLQSKNSALQQIIIQISQKSTKRGGMSSSRNSFSFKKVRVNHGNDLPGPFQLLEGKIQSEEDANSHSSEEKGVTFPESLDRNKMRKTFENNQKETFENIIKTKSLPQASNSDSTLKKQPPVGDESLKTLNAGNKISNICQIEPKFSETKCPNQEFIPTERNDDATFENQISTKNPSLEIINVSEDTKSCKEISTCSSNQSVENKPAKATDKPKVVEQPHKKSQIGIEKATFVVEDASDVSDECNSDFCAVEAPNLQESPLGQVSILGDCNFDNRRFNQRNIFLKKTRRGGVKRRNRRLRGRGRGRGRNFGFGGGRQDSHNSYGWSRTKNGNVFYYPEPEKSGGRSRSRNTRSGSRSRDRSVSRRRSRSPSRGRYSTSSSDSDDKSYRRRRSRSSSRDRSSRSRESRTLAQPYSVRSKVVVAGQGDKADFTKKNPSDVIKLPSKKSTTNFEKDTESSISYLVSGKSLSSKEINHSKPFYKAQTVTPKVDIREVLEAAKLHIKSKQDSQVDTEHTLIPLPPVPTTTKDADLKPKSLIQSQIGSSVETCKNPDQSFHHYTATAELYADRSRSSGLSLAQDEDSSELLMLAIDPEDLVVFGTKN